MEKRLESLFEKDSEADTTKFQSPWPPSEGANSGSGAPAGRRTLESHGAVDAIVDALDMAAAEVQRRRVGFGTINVLLCVMWNLLVLTCCLPPLAGG